MAKYITTLTIAGSDSGGGAGIEADIKTMSALGCYAASAVTAVTVQNTMRVGAVHIVPPDVIYEQIRAVTSDLHPSCIKTGMLADAASVKAVTDAIKAYREENDRCRRQPLFVVADPVMVSSSGQRLMSVEAVEVYKKELMPLVTLLTPNLPEAGVLTGINVTESDKGMEAAARIMKLGVTDVLLKGGHAAGNDGTVMDSLYGEAVGSNNIVRFMHKKVLTSNTHGTGCTLSSAICASMAVRISLAETVSDVKPNLYDEVLPKAVADAEDYMYNALKAGADVNIGDGCGPVNHFFDPHALIKVSGG